MYIVFSITGTGKNNRGFRVMNRKMSSAAYELGMRHVPSMNRRSSVNFYNRTVRSTRVTYAAKENILPTVLIFRAKRITRIRLADGTCVSETEAFLYME